jgi:hypothetical protein
MLVVTTFFPSDSAFNASALFFGRLAGGYEKTRIEILLPASYLYQLSNPIVQPQRGDICIAPGKRGEPQASVWCLASLRC